MAPVATFVFILLGVYAHMIDSFLYLPDYPVGHMIAYQIEERMYGRADRDAMMPCSARFTLPAARRTRSRSS